MRYRPNLPLSLRDLSFVVEPGEHVGICGRTGAGKSSLILALFRLVEASEGRIWLDKYDISKLSLRDLRRCISIIPQDPTLFQASLRFNLDPTSECSDDELVSAMRRVSLSAKLDQLGGLDGNCVEGSFSAGEKQLVCFARALLRKSTRIVLLDEISANCDSETDSIIQKLVSEEFRDRTVMVIAHRLASIMNCDKILVLSEGRLEQFGSPSELLSKTKGEFYSMAKEVGLA